MKGQGEIREYVDDVPAAPCAEAYFQGRCETMRQCCACGRWQCVERLRLILCTLCRKEAP